MKLTEEQRLKRNAYMAEWNKRNRAKVIARHRDYYNRNREAFSVKAKEYRKVNCERLKLTGLKFREANRERLRVVNRERYRSFSQEGKARVVARSRQWKLNNPERTKELRRRYRVRYKETIRIKARAWKAARRARKAKVLTDSAAKLFFNFVRSQKRIPCYYCHKTISGKDAHIDHVLVISKSGNHTSDNLCASCSDCNHSKWSKSLADWIPKTGQPLLNF